MMDPQELRQHITELLISRMNGMYEADLLIYQAEKLREYIQDGTIPPIPQAPQVPQTLSGSTNSKANPVPSTGTKPIRDYYNRP